MFGRIQKAAASAIFPARCQACGALFHPPEKPEKQAPTDVVAAGTVDMAACFSKEMAPYVCGECINRFLPVAGPFCPQCGKMVEPRSQINCVCGDGMAAENGYQAVRSAGLLEGALMDVIHAFKYNGKIQLARPLGRLLLAALMRDSAVGDIDAVIPVPLHRARLRRRGFNQALLMLREWPDSVPIQRAGIVIEKNVLVRVKHTPSQTGLGREKRKANVRKAFAVNYPDNIKNKRVLLVDDVFTTGATCAECARVLLTAGAASVSVLTAAHAD